MAESILNSNVKRSNTRITPPCAAADPAGASRLQFVHPAGRVAALGSLDRFARLVKLKAKANRVELEGGHLDLPLRVIEAIRHGERVLVVHDWMAYPRGLPAPNLVAYATDGRQLWTAENLERGIGETDAYVGFLTEEPLWVANFAGFRCRIDPETGRLLESEFTK
jgi:hypothetical protein